MSSPGGQLDPPCEAHCEADDGGSCLVQERGAPQPPLPQRVRRRTIMACQGRGDEAASAEAPLRAPSYSAAETPHVGPTPQRPAPPGFSGPRLQAGRLHSSRQVHTQGVHCRGQRRRAKTQTRAVAASASARSTLSCSLQGGRQAVLGCTCSWLNVHQQLFHPPPPGRAPTPQPQLHPHPQPQSPRSAPQGTSSA
jgi:hypothetical protein